MEKRQIVNIVVSLLTSIIYTILCYIKYGLKGLILIGAAIIVFGLAYRILEYLRTGKYPLWVLYGLNKIQSNDNLALVFDIILLALIVTITLLK